MRAEEVRIRVLSDHRELRERMAKLEQLALAVENGERLPWGVLRAEGESFLEQLAQHMRWEDLHLVPVLREIDAWGECRSSKLADEHRVQRELLEYVVHQLRDEERPESLVAGDLADLVELLRKDMDEEEAAFLAEEILRDDPVAIDAFSG